MTKIFLGAINWKNDFWTRSSSCIPQKKLHWKMRTDFCQCIWLYQYLAKELVNQTGKHHQQQNVWLLICGEQNWWFSKEFKHLKKIYDINDLRPASSSIEITAKVDSSFYQNYYPALDFIDLSASESSESSGSYGSAEFDIWDDLAENFTRLAAELNQTKAIEHVDPEVSTVYSGHSKT